MYEKRLLATEVRASKSGDKRTITGYAATYNSLSKDLGGWREKIAPGAFKRILSTNPDVVLNFNHNMSVILGRTSAGTLRLREDRKGLLFACDLPNTTAGNDVWESVQRGDLSSMSFSFNVAPGMDSMQEEEIETDGGIRGAVKRTVKMVVRTVRDFANLFDCSVVTDPAYLGTNVGVARGLVVSAELRSRVAEFAKPPAYLVKAKEDWMENKLRRRNEERQHRADGARRRREVLELL